MQKFVWQLIKKGGGVHLVFPRLNPPLVTDSDVWRSSITNSNFSLLCRSSETWASVALKEKCDNLATFYDVGAQLCWWPVPFGGRSYVCPASNSVLLSFPKGTYVDQLRSKWSKSPRQCLDTSLRPLSISKFQVVSLRWDINGQDLYAEV